MFQHLYEKGKVDENGKRKRGRRIFKCPHGVQRKCKGQGQRPSQRINFSKCPVQISILEQDDDTWIVTSCDLIHEVHPVNASNYYSHNRQKKLSEEDFEYVRGLVNAKVNARNIARLLINRTEKDFSYRDVANIIARIRKDQIKCPVE